MGFGFEKLVVIGIIALFLLGPERLPGYAQKLGQFVRTGRRMLDEAKDRMQDELGDDFKDVDWQKLDPRQYDPRRIIRDALLEPPAPRDADPEPEPEPVAAPKPLAERTAVFDPEST